MAVAAGALVMSSFLSVAPAQAAVSTRVCTAADAEADGVYDLALKSPHLYPTKADAAAAAKAAYTRRILGEHSGYNGNGRGPGEFDQARELCRKALAPPSGAWV
jgi:hypothetical protein